MYHTFYKLQMPPFENTPDPRFFFETEQHREALAAIEYAIRMGKGFVMVTGAIGTGKTTVSRAMMHRLADQARIVTVLHGHTSADGMLRQVLESLGFECPADAEHSVLLAQLAAVLEQFAEANQPVVLMVDEAQTLRDEALEELRLLSNFDTATRKLVQVVLIGQPELRQRVRGPKLAALRQRIVLSKQLKPLDRNDTAGYIEHRLRTASEDAEHIVASFSEDAITAIHRFAGGVPRLINFVCDNALLLGYVRNCSEPIDQSIIDCVIEDMLPSLDSPAAKTTTPKVIARNPLAEGLMLRHAV